MGVSCGRGKEDEDLMFKSIFRKEILCLVGFLFAFDVVLSLWGFDPLIKFSVSFAMYIIVDSYMFRRGEVVCIYVSKYLVVEME
jgi:hypothetical protein